MQVLLPALLVLAFHLAAFWVCQGAVLHKQAFDQGLTLAVCLQSRIVQSLGSPIAAVLLLSISIATYETFRIVRPGLHLYVEHCDLTCSVCPCPACSWWCRAWRH